MLASDIPDDLKKKLEKWESNRPENRTLRVLEDIASMMQEVSSTLSEKPDDSHDKKIGAILVDMRESLSAIKSKEDPEIPDFSKPILEGLSKLEKALTAAVDNIDMKPQFNPNIQVDTPNVNISAPDLSGVEKILKADIPKAFKAAIALIPENPEMPTTDLTKLENLLSGMTEQLESIDTASRMKPQFPSTLKVTNPDGSGVAMGRLVTEKFDKIEASYPTTSTEVYDYSYQSATVAQVTVTYTDATKEVLLSAERTV